MTTGNAMLLPTQAETAAGSLPRTDDPRYFPASFNEHLNGTFCGPGTNPRIYREYMHSDIARGREIVRAMYVQVGNTFSPEQLLGDHHLRLPGITLLSRPQAIEYYCTRMHRPESGYAVGYWRDERFYGNAFRRRGVKLTRLDRFPTPDHVRLFANLISEMCVQLKQDLWPDLRPQLGQRMKRRMLKIAKLYVHASRQLAVIAAQQPAQLEEACDALTGRMLVPVLRFVGTREARNEGGGA